MAAQFKQSMPVRRSIFGFDVFICVECGHEIAFDSLKQKYRHLNERNRGASATSYFTDMCLEKGCGCRSPGMYRQIQN